MTNGGGHLTRTLLIPKDFPDILLVQRGSDGNVDAGAKNITNGRSMIRIFNLTEVATMPVAYATGGTLLAWGLRNAVGVAQNPVTGEIVCLFRLSYSPSDSLTLCLSLGLTQQSGQSIKARMMFIATA